MGRIWFVVTTVCAFNFNTELGYLVLAMMVMGWLHGEHKHKQKH